MRVQTKSSEAQLKNLGQTVAAFRGKFDPKATLGISRDALKAWGAALGSAGKSLAAATEGHLASPVRTPGRKTPTAPPSAPSRKKTPEKKAPAKTPSKPTSPGWSPKKPGRPLE